MMVELLVVAYTRGFTQPTVVDDTEISFTNFLTTYGLDIQTEVLMGQLEIHAN
jgi:hypothetical protein